MRDELLHEIERFRDETGLSETYLGKQAGCGTSFFDRVRNGGANLRSIDKFRAFASEWRAKHGASTPGTVRPAAE